MENNVPLTPEIPPDILNPEPHDPPAGDWKDDDGDAIGSYFMHGDMGPLANYLVKSLQKSFDFKPEKASRMTVASAQFYDVASAAYPYAARRVLPADPNRQLLVFQSGDNGFQKGCWFHSESFAATSDPGTQPETQGIFLPAKTQLVIPNYTGPVWVAPANVGSSGVCQWWILGVTA